MNFINLECIKDILIELREGNDLESIKDKYDQDIYELTKYVLKSESFIELSDQPKLLIKGKLLLRHLQEELDWEQIKEGMFRANAYLVDYLYNVANDIAMRKIGL